MKKIAILAPAALLVLSACGESTDASEEAMADTVEINADAAMEGTPDPVADGDLATDDAAIDDAVNAATADAENAADAAQATVDDVLDAAGAADAANDAMADTVE